MQGKTVDIDIDDFTGIEEREFRLATGRTITEALAGYEVGDISLETLAGFVWVARKRTEDKLDYIDVLGKIRYRDLIDSFADGEDSEGDETKEGDGDPPS